MNLSTATTLLVALVAPAQAFLPVAPARCLSSLKMGYLDDLSQYMGTPEEEPEEDDSREATKLESDKVDRGGVGDWSGFVDFNGALWMRNTVLHYSRDFLLLF